MAEICHRPWFPTRKSNRLMDTGIPTRSKRRLARTTKLRQVIVDFVRSHMRTEFPQNQTIKAIRIINRRREAIPASCNLVRDLLTMSDSSQPVAWCLGRAISCPTRLVTRMGQANGFTVDLQGLGTRTRRHQAGGVNCGAGPGSARNPATRPPGFAEPLALSAVFR